MYLRVTGARVAQWSEEHSRLEAYACLASVIRPEGPAPKGQESLAQGLPWVTRNKCFALKGLEVRRRSASKVRSRFSPYLSAPFRAHSGGGINPG
jgi:hypothetical protein